MSTYRKTEFWDINPILKANAHYNVVIGERSNGKTYGTLVHALEHYFKTGGEFCIIRRLLEDFRGKKGETFFNAIVDNGIIEKLSDGCWTDIYYRGQRWYLCCYDGDGKRVVAENPFCYGFALSQQEHYKGNSYPRIETIIFDEFISRNLYLNDEFIMFMNIISTIARGRENIKIFMLANTVNKYCPYFKEMGLRHIADMKQGDIDLYTYGESDLKVAVEYCAPYVKGKKSDVYFAFDNPKLNMITNGIWEIDIYPHLPYKYKPKDILGTYFIIFDGNILQCEIIQKGDDLFTYIHRKTTEIRNENDIVYSIDYSPNPYHYRRLTDCIDSRSRSIAEFFRRDKVFYQDNEVGEIVRNYFLWGDKH